MIALRTEEEIKKLRIANQIVKEVLETVRRVAKEGMTTQELDEVAEEITYKRGAKPAFKGYRGFPKSLCTSINDEVVHGIPSKDRVLRGGDLLKVDYGVSYEGYYGDSACTVVLGSVSPEVQRLVDVTRDSLFKGIEKARAGNTISDISRAIQEHVEKNGFSVVREFVGHGVGRSPHEEPPVPNYFSGKRGPVLKEGMVLAIEPMVNMKGYDVRVLDDHWTAVTVDGAPSAHFEHSIAITNGDPLILSL